jgi:hypothetical protein
MSEGIYLARTLQRKVSMHTHGRYGSSNKTFRSSLQFDTLIPVYIKDVSKIHDVGVISEFYFLSTCRPY